MAAIRALGYIGLAALVSGEAATGLTTVSFTNGRLCLAGPRNKAGNHHLKRIKGSYFTKGYNGAKSVWTVPATATEAFYTVVMTYWPNFEGLDEAIAAAKAAPVTAVEVPPAPVKAAPIVTVTIVGEWLKISSPYNDGFLAAIRFLHSNTRKWNQVEKVWEVTANNKSYVDNMIAKHYPTAKYIQNVINAA